MELGNPRGPTFLKNFCFNFIHGKYITVFPKQHLGNMVYVQLAAK